MGAAPDTRLVVCRLQDHGDQALRRLDGLPKAGQSQDHEQLGAIVDYCLEAVPEQVAAWAKDVRKTMNQGERNARHA